MTNVHGHSHSICLIIKQSLNKEKVWLVAKLNSSFSSIVLCSRSNPVLLLNIALTAKSMPCFVDFSDHMPVHVCHATVG